MTLARQLRVTQVMLSKGFGGGERLFVDLCRTLADAGIAVQAICHPRFRKIRDLRKYPGLNVNAVLTLGNWDKLAVWALRRALASFGPDLIHTHLARGAHMAGLAAEGLRVPLVANLHNYVDLKYYRRVHHFVAATNDQRRYLLDQGLPDRGINVIPHFSLLPSLDASAPAATGRPVLVSYGRLVEKKGFDLLVQAVAELRHCGTDVDLIIGGSGPELGRLRLLVEQLELGARVRFAGWVDDVASLLGEGDVFVLPSRDEPFGIAVLEGMACGLPIVSTLTQGPREILDGTLAYLAKPGDAKSLAEALYTAVTNPQASLKKAENAAIRYRERFAHTIVVPRLIELYQRLVTVHSDPPPLSCGSAARVEPDSIR